MPVELPTIPEAISSAAFLQYLARRAVAGTLTGFHRSGLFGSSIEFADHKPYTPGDDLKHIDWKVYGRADKFYLKRFEDETNLRSYLVLDLSASMDYGTIGFKKAHYAIVLAATLAYLFVQQQDQVGLLRFGPAEDQYVPPRGRMPHFQYLSELLREMKPGGERKVDAALQFLVERVHRRSVVVVISDFLAPIHEVEKMARLFKAGKHEVRWFQVLDPSEIDFPFRDWKRFEGLEGEGEIQVHGREASLGYRREIARWISELRDIALKNGIVHRLVRTDEPLPQVMASILK